MAHRYLICELVTGTVLDEVPMQAETDLTRLLQAYGEGTLTLPLRDSRGELVAPNWEQDIQPWRTLILVVDDADNIVWHGIPIKRNRTPASQVKFICRTIEAYLVERYVQDLTWVQGDQTSEIFLRLVSDAGAAINLEYDCPPSGVLRDRKYLWDDKASTYDRINELASVLNGFQWTIDVTWGDQDHTYVRKTVRTGYPYLGHRDGAPPHVFETGQNITDFDHNDEEGPTAVWAEGDLPDPPEVPEGDPAPPAPTRRAWAGPVVDTFREASGWPRRELRQAFSGVKVQDTIERHAFGLAHYLFGGVESVELTCRNPTPNEDFTRLGDFSLGDNAHVIINSDSLTLDAVWPVVGWSLTPKTGIYKPVLANLGGYLVE